MRSQIRQQVFETNSSSTHSISIAEDSLEMIMDTSLIPDEHGYIRLKGGEFGWEWRRYNDAITKANYVAVLLMHLKSDVIRWKEMDEAVIESYGKNSSHMNLLKWADKNYRKCYLTFNKVIKNQTSCKYISLDTDPDYKNDNYSYIDHQSCDELRHFNWLLDEERVHKFIFNRNSWLFTGNDNGRSSCTFKDVPVYKQDEVIEPVYKYEVALDGYNKTEKFQKMPSGSEIEYAIDYLCENLYVREDGSFDDDHSVEAQMRRNEEKVYRHSYEKENDFTTNTVFFVKDVHQIVHQKWEEGLAQKKWSADDRWEKQDEIKKELYGAPDSPYVKKVKFAVREIAA